MDVTTTRAPFQTTGVLSYPDGTLAVAGLIKALDTETGLPVGLTAIQNTSGDWVLRIVNESPQLVSLAGIIPTVDGKVPFEAEVTINEAKMEGSPDGGINWIPVKVTTDGIAHVQKQSCIKQAPAHGVKQVTTVAAEVFAGASKLANRYCLMIYNDGSYPIYWGATGVTASTGQVLAPGTSLILEFSPYTVTAIFAIASQSVNIRVTELA